MKDYEVEVTLPVDSGRVCDRNANKYVRVTIRARDGQAARDAAKAMFPAARSIRVKG